MKTFFLILALTIISTHEIFSQYFQQEVNTTIDVRLNDLDHQLSAFETIEYTNNSKDTLAFIYFHLWPNAYKNNKTQLAQHLNEGGDLNLHFAEAEDRGFIDSLDFKSNGKELKLEYNENIDYVKVILNKSLAPSKTILITTPFRVKIPYGNISRLGHLGQAYQLTQWFPKPAVYDLNGWNVMPYLSQGEFYSEYGSYDVRITIPENYVVGATGDLVNGEKELEWLGKKDLKTRELINSGKQIDLDDMEHPKSSSRLKTLHYHQENVHDFAFFADKRWHVLKGEVELPYSKRKVTTWAMFTNNEFHLWKDAINYLDSSIYYYSLWTGDYPYNQVTAVDGALTAGAGMEYPNVTVIGESYNASALEQVIIHEVGHNWFYGILGSNERKHAWMDEGINSYTENRTTETLHPKAGFPMFPSNISRKIGLSQYKARGLHDLLYLANARRNYDQAIETPSPLFTPTNYGAIIYSKTAIGFDYLLAYLGDSLFNECMHTYFNEWKFKHPQPKDIKAVFTTVSKKNLDWFFGDYINTTKKIDYEILKFGISHDTLIQYNSISDTIAAFNELTVKNNTGLKSPISIYGLNKKDSIVFVQWEDGFLGKKKIKLNAKANLADRIILDYNMDSPELDRTNDVIKTHGVFKKAKPIRLKLLGGIENRKYNTVNWSPVYGWNNSDKSMLGISFYNTSFLEKKTEWLLIPMYSFGNKSLTGLGSITQKWFPKSFARKIDLGYSINSFSFEGYSTNTKWYKSKIESNLEFYRKKLRTKAKQTLHLAYISIVEEQNSIKTTNYFNASYKVKNKQILKPASLEVDYNYSFENLNTINLTAKKRFNYNLDLDGIEFRLFTGKTIQQNKYSNKYNWRTSGKTGRYDYKYENIFLGRSATQPNFLSQQIGNSDGGFKTYTNTGSSSDWLIALNTKIDLPKIPFGLFADFSLYPYTLVSQNSKTSKIGNNYDLGVWIPIKKDFIELFIPLKISKNIEKELNYRQINFWQRITFIINFKSMNPFKLIDQSIPY